MAERKDAPIQTRNKQSPSRVYRKPVKSCHIYLTSDTFHRWCCIGTELGLSSNTDIANFLIHYYMTSPAHTSHCSVCNALLTLYCLNCHLPSQENKPPQSPSPNNCVVSSSQSETTECTLQITTVSAYSEQMDKRKKTENLGKKQSGNSLTLKHHKCGAKKDRNGRKSHRCRECGSVFSRSGGLKVHLRVHTGERPYKCQHCAEAFSQSGQLTAHVRKHTGERPFVCEKCGSSFPLSGSLKQHMRIHTGEKPFSCNVCGKKFSYAGDLTVHARKHSGDKPFLCQDCGKAFAVSSDLTKHKKVHSGDKPFPCAECGKAFPFLNRLTAHMRTHTGDRPFLCQECGAAFSRASNLTVHKRTHHTHEKPFRCLHCGMAFSDSANLSKHRKNKHRKDIKNLKLSPLTTHHIPLPQNLIVHSNSSAADKQPEVIVEEQTGNLTPQEVGTTEHTIPANTETGLQRNINAEDLSGHLGTSGPSIFPLYNYYCYQQAQH